MAEIGSVVLASQHAAKREFSYNGNPLPSELTVTVGSQQLTVRCRGNRDECRNDGEEWCRREESVHFEHDRQHEGLGNENIKDEDVDMDGRDDSYDEEYMMIVIAALVKIPWNKK
ncbi:hypothetical protein Golob_024544 [Gossypium lobatum]|uniref:Uncharacterized protein n=1 Tax=Gossypium lobatum TaxID=34289 RepID=A0A7J8NL78_9ROSI|nr:hypothetical protein [Gossypium lobatum]